MPTRLATQTEPLGIIYFTPDTAKERCPGLRGSERVLLEPNMRVELWRRVEPRKIWERAERRHYRKHLRTSAVLLNALAGRQQRTAACTQRELPIKLPERKHFDQSDISHLVQRE